MLTILTVDCHMWICFADCPDGCSFCTYDASASQTKCVTGQCKAGFVMKSDESCFGKKPLGLYEEKYMYDYKHITVI